MAMPLKSRPTWRHWRLAASWASTSSWPVEEVVGVAAAKVARSSTTAAGSPDGSPDGSGEDSGETGAEASYEG